MNVSVEIDAGIAVLRISRGKVNALNEALVREIDCHLDVVEGNEAVRAVILTGAGKFFCFGFDIPELLGYSKEAFIGHLTAATNLYDHLFSFPKPVVASINGHAAAGGCVLALACDHRIMARGNAKIGLTELNLGSTLTAGGLAMLQYCAGAANAEKIVYSGKLFTAEEALGLSLINETAEPEALAAETLRVARNFAGKEPRAFRSIKAGLRGPVAGQMRARQSDSIREFADIWYSENTRERLEKVKIFA